MSHSKRNTSRAVFTSHERDLAKAAWTSSSARLNRDSFLPFGSCYLCLQIAREPVSCSHGDLFCRECAVSNLLAQKKEIKRLARAREKAEQDLRDATARQDEEAQKRAIEDFESIQAGLKPASRHASTGSKPQGKRKHASEETEPGSSTSDERAKVRKTVDEDTSKEKAPFFWTPSQTPGVDPIQAAASQGQGKATPICPASSDQAQHTYSLKGLQPVIFTEETDSKGSEGTKRVCPSCRKLLGNASRPVMAKNCGHVLCRSCVVKFIPPAKDGIGAEAHSCFVCDSSLGSEADKESRSKRHKDEFPGMIELRSEGTGFSARGSNKIRKEGTAFQC